MSGVEQRFPDVQRTTSYGDVAPSPPSPRAAAASERVSSATVEGNDGICFTAGPEAAVIGLGTIHAYLAARRKCPKVAAGISIGAVNAVAMQRVYREIADSAGKSREEQEAARWAWFRHYVQTVSDQPLNVVWNGIPDQSDFFADMVPIRDTSVPAHLQAEETTARRRQYLLVKLGRWLAKLPVSVSLVFGLIVSHVRRVERYPLEQKAVSAAAFACYLASLATRLVLYVCGSPQFFPEDKFRDARPAAFWSRPPVVGWVNLTSLAMLAALVPSLMYLGYRAPSLPWTELRIPPRVLLLAILAIAVAAALRGWLVRWRLVGRIVSAIMVVVAVALSLGNFLLVSMVVGALVRALYLYASGDTSIVMLSMPARAADAVFLDAVLCVLFVPLVVVRGTRRWLVDHGFLREVPHPLFGWGLFLFFWVHLIALAAYFALGGYLVIHLVDAHPVRSAIRVMIGVSSLLVGAALPLLPVLLLIPFWRWMRGPLHARRRWLRRLALGGSLMLSSVLIAVGLVVCAYGLKVMPLLFEHSGLDTPWRPEAALWQVFAVAAFALTLTWLAMLTALTQPVVGRWLATRLLARLGLRDSLIHDLHLHLKLLRLFDAQWAENKRRPRRDIAEPLLTDDPMRVVVVAASLQTLYEKGQPKFAYQLWAKNRTPLLHALRAALAVPPLFSPVRITGEQLTWWLNDGVRNDPDNKRRFARGIDLVDGSVVRQNPLPALYTFLRKETRVAEEMAARNDAEHPGIHVVYGVPIQSRAAAERAVDPSPNSDPRTFRNTIVDVGRLSLRLSHRRDTQLEVRQTNVIARLEALIPTRSPRPDSRTHAIHADEIAPEADLDFDDPLKPAPDKILAGVAMGCRRSLEILYRHELARTFGRSQGAVSCTTFLASMGRLPATVAGQRPGLPEVCRQCTGRLRALSASETSTVSVEGDLGDKVALIKRHPQLTGQTPRIVFVASGGVFRGAFHIGVLAALHAAGIKPDLVVGASVGTLMGGALAAMFVHKDVLPKLVDAFLRVDETVALTAKIKSAARELGIRGRAIDLSPRDVRRLLRRGARSDPSFATTGAPAALIDALSDLLMIPHRETGAIAAEFVAGRVTGALTHLIDQIRTETITRLDIERAAIGTSLLEEVIFDVLIADTPAFRHERQPFQNAGIAFYGTTTNLSTQRLVLLGGHGLHPGAPYDFVEAALASSAFPAVFPPRPESDVFPGTGHADTLFADGGMFDNLPFLPAIEILSRAQGAYRTTSASPQTTVDFLRQRLAQPDLFIAGALDAVAERDDRGRGSFSSLAAIRNRASSLHHNMKIRAFELASRRIYGQLLRLEANPPAGLAGTSGHFVDRMVNAAVLPVFPRSTDHLNGTFAFSTATGLDRHRVRKSIADGCYQTLMALAQEHSKRNVADLDRAPELLTAKSVKVLVDTGRIRSVEYDLDLFVPNDLCPYFRRAGERFTCPFALPPSVKRPTQMRDVFQACGRDSTHHDATASRPRAAPPAPPPVPNRPAVIAVNTANGEAEGKMQVWRKRNRGLERQRSEVLAEIEGNRVAFTDMVMRAAMTPPAAPPPPASPPGAPPGGQADIARIQHRFEELRDIATQAKTADELQQALEEAEALAALRAYICPVKEIPTEAKSCLATLVDWGVPSTVVDTLKETAAPALASPITDPDQARGALHAVYEEYDSWASYLDTYNRNTGTWATRLMTLIAIVTAVTLVSMLGWSLGLVGVFLASIGGAMASVIARLPGLTRYGEWMVNLRAFQARIATGIVGSLVGIGLLSSGLISITLPVPGEKAWEKSEYLFTACLTPTPRGAKPPSPSGQTPKPSSATETPAASSTGATTAPQPANPIIAVGDDKATATRCTPGAGLFLIAITMLLGFSERILTSLETRVVSPAGSGSDQQKGK